MRELYSAFMLQSGMHRKTGINSVTGTGQVLFGPAEDAEGNKVVDADGKEILYPRSGAGQLVHRMIFL